MSTDTIPFYNTTGLISTDLVRAKASATSQDAIILSHFNAHPDTPYSPSDIHTLLFTSATPITSVRRSMSSLTRAGHLIKLTGLVDGIYGRHEHVWRYNPSACSAVRLPFRGRGCAQV